MSLITPLIKEILIDGVLVARLRSKAEAKMLGFGLYAIAGLFAAAGAAFLIYAGFLALETIYTPLESALWAGGIMLALAAIAGVAASVYLHRRKKHSLAGTEELSAAFHSLFDTLEHEISGPIRENPKTAIALAGLAGLMARHYIRS
jgi:hypothetical protein